jgi:hypothetical protein
MPGILFDYAIGGVLGVPMLVLILMPAFSSGDYLTLAILSTTAGAPHIITFFVARPRRRLKLVAKALRLNSGIEGLPEP